jgi:hypothetical protein
MEQNKRNEIEVTPISANPLGKNCNSGILLFITGHMYDRNCNYEGLVQDIVQVICTISPLHFGFESEFDQKGVLSWFRDVSSCRVIDKERVIFSTDKIVYIPENSELNPSPVEILGNIIKGYFESKLSLDDLKCPLVDLQQFRLRATHVTVSIEGNYHREIEFYGSNDKILWSRIDVINHLNTEEMGNEFEESKVRTWKLQSNEYFQYFKVLLFFTTRAGGRVFRWALSGLEMYGDLVHLTLLSS